MVAHPDRWRLDQLLAWEEKRLALAEAASDSRVSPKREAAGIADLLPQSALRARPIVSATTTTVTKRRTGPPD